MKAECPVCGKLHKSKRPKAVCGKCKQGGVAMTGSTIQFGDGPPIPVKSWKIEMDPSPQGSCSSYASTAAMHPMCRCSISLPPLDLLLLLEGQVGELPSSAIRDNCGHDIAIKGVPVKLYERHADLLADFFVECMEQQMRVAYIKGDSLIRSDT